MPPQRYAHCIATTSWSRHPETGDQYPIYNKPASLLEWLYRDRPEGTVLLLDPDCLFLKPVTRRVAPGAPVAQKWNGLSPSEASSDKPFGLDGRFGFLGAHCANTALESPAVMIPKLIHTSDLRRICARWLELTGLVREHYRDTAGNAIWEADMYAYLIASAEYGLHHEPASLGVCTNWHPDEAPDAPIIHYCQPIKDQSGEEIFSKQSYVPWTPIAGYSDPEHDYGRDLINLVNDLVIAKGGKLPPANSESRPKWRDGVLEGRVIDDILLERPANERNLWLNASGKAIWELCDGSRTVAEIGSALGDRYATNGHDMTSDVLATINRLQSVGFVDIR